MQKFTSNLPVGILCKQDITEAIDNGELITNADKNFIEASSYDMRIGTIFRNGQILNASHPEAHKQIIVQPGEIISIFTLEELNLPSDIAATAFAMNQQSSRGLLVLNPGHVDPGFKGPLTVMALNLRRVPLAISRGSPIFTVIFEHLPKSTTSPYNKNEPRDRRELRYNEQNVEQAPKDLTELVVIGKNAPFPTRQEVKELIQTHWMSWLTLILTFVAALTGIIAVILATVFR